MSDFNGLVAVVTSAPRGLERPPRSCSSGAVARRGPGPQHGRRTQRSVGVRCNITDTAAVDESVATVVDRLGGLDLMVNNAGIGAVGDVARNDDVVLTRLLDVNVTGIARVTRAALPQLRRSPLAAVVNTSSAAAFGVRQRALYGANQSGRCPTRLCLDPLNRPWETDAAWASGAWAAAGPTPAAAGRSRSPRPRCEAVARDRGARLPGR
jgi:2-keto-3-deoxy-L-fuconate dehydrogenase